ncbi:MAG: DUF3047 domain-containing protein [Gemmatimonadetes bacterium]|jgi:hypothetical protein|nr:DUF3047 domain-containing protein [Gemmatimonadota bacterium]
MTPLRYLVHISVFASLLLLLGASRPVGAQTDLQGEPFVRATLGSLAYLLESPPVSFASTADSLLDSTLDLNKFADKAFGAYLEKTLDYYKKLLPEEDYRQLLVQYRSQLHASLRWRLIDDLALQLHREPLTAIRLESQHFEGEKGKVELIAEQSTGPISIRADLQRTQAGWRIVDISVDGRRLSAHYRKLCDNILDEKYSLAVLTSFLKRREYILLDDFSTTSPGQCPLDWVVWRPKDKKKPLHYQVVEENGQHVMAARDSGSSVILAKSLRWNPRQYPIMTWCWKTTALPPGGDERYNHTNDSAAGLYVVFSYNWFGAPKQLKYVWSSTLPEGTVGKRDMIFRPWFFVLESGEENLGRWTFETVDLEAHYKLKLGGKPDKKTDSVHILTDANSTKSYAEAYYADLRVWPREALEQGRVENYCDCLNSGADSAAPLRAADGDF